MQQSSKKWRKQFKQFKTVIIVNMEHYKIFKLLNDSAVSKFLIKKWNKINYLLSSFKPYLFASKKIRFKTSMIRSNLCGYSDA